MDGMTGFRARAAFALSLAAAIAPGVTMAQGLPRLRMTDDGGTLFRIYGHINQAILNYDDGGETRTYAPVDNSHSSSRIGLRTETPIDGGWSLQTNFEGQYAPNPSSKVSQRDSFVGDWALEWTDLRKAEAIISNPAYGVLWLGQGSMASDSTAELDFSGTTVIAYSSVSDAAGGQFFRFGGGVLSDLTVGSVFTNYDGSRRLRVRYDTPVVSGFSGAVAYGREVLTPGDDTNYYDAALRWSDESPDFKAGAQFGYNWKGSDSETIDGSASVLHFATGLNVTLAAGGQTVGGSGQYVYGKLGLIRDFVELGPTALSLDGYLGGDIGAEGGDSTSYAFAAVQKVSDWNLDVYGAVRVYQFDDKTASYQDGLALMGGMRFSF